MPEATPIDRNDSPEKWLFANHSAAEKTAIPAENSFKKMGMKKILVLFCLLAFLSSCIRYTPMQQSWQPKSYKKMPNKTPRAYKK
jgi:hypothetical protein